MHMARTSTGEAKYCENTVCKSTSDNAESQIHMNELGSQRTECKSGTKQKTASYCHGTTAKLVAQLASYWRYNDTVTHTHNFTSTGTADKATIR